MAPAMRKAFATTEHPVRRAMASAVSPSRLVRVKFAFIDNKLVAARKKNGNMGEVRT